VGKNVFFNIPFKSSSVAGEVWNQTLANFLPTCVSNIATFKKNTYDPNIAIFLLFSSCCKTVGENMFFNIPLESSSMAGEVERNSRQFFPNKRKNGPSVAIFIVLLQKW